METNLVAAGENYKVRLVSVIDNENRVVFDVTPSFSESRSVEYTQVTPIHMPGSVQVYKNTSSRTFSITAHLISRNVADAAKNMFYLQRLRAWALPFFGLGSSTGARTDPAKASRSAELDQQLDAAWDPQNQDPNQLDSIQAVEAAIQNLQSPELLGAPPEVLYLYAYSASQGGGRSPGLVNINRIPVVLTTLEIVYPEDIDYIPSSDNGEPFPVKMDVTITLIETHSPREYERFSLADFKRGQLVNF